MEFGYFTLSDNHYANSSRKPNQLVTDITAEALYAEQIGMHSAWIGEHHFNSLGVLSCPDLVLAYVAAKTKRIRLAPAVTVLPLHHPIRVAEQWATLDLLSNGRVDFACGRGYDRREYEPFSVSFDDNQSAFEEGLQIVHKLWGAEGRLSHHGKHYSFDDVRITPKPVQRPIPTYVGSFSKPSIELADRGCNPSTRHDAVDGDPWAIAAQPMKERNDKNGYTFLTRHYGTMKVLDALKLTTRHLATAPSNFRLSAAKQASTKTALVVQEAAPLRPPRVAIPAPSDSASSFAQAMAGTIGI